MLALKFVICGARVSSRLLPPIVKPRCHFGTAITGLLAIMNDPPRRGSDSHGGDPERAGHPTHTFVFILLHKNRSLVISDTTLKLATQLPPGDGHLPLGARRGCGVESQENPPSGEFRESRAI